MNCIRSLADSDFLHNGFEIIVVNDGGEDVVNALKEKFSTEIKIIVLNQENHGPATARNKGAWKAEGKYLLFLDDDCTVQSDTLYKLLDECRKSHKKMVGGKTFNALRDNIFSITSQSIVNYLYEYYNRNSETSRFFTSNNLMVPRSDFLNLGGFKEDIPIAGGEDRILCESWYRKGWSMCYLPKAKVFHHHELNLNRFIKQQYNYGIGIHWFNNYIQKESSEKRKYERLAFYLQLVWHPFKSYPIIQASKMTSLIMVAQVANLFGYIKAVLKSG